MDGTAETITKADAQMVGAAMAAMAEAAKSQADRDRQAKLQRERAAREYSSTRRIEALDGVKEVRVRTVEYLATETEEGEPVERKRWRLDGEAELADGRTVAATAFDAGTLELRLYQRTWAALRGLPREEPEGPAGDEVTALREENRRVRARVDELEKLVRGLAAKN